MSKAPKVILIHGILNIKYYMAWMARYLKKKNYEVVLFGYPSTKYTVSDLVEWMHPKIKSLVTDPNDPVNFVCHSMGGVLLRAYLEKYSIPNLNRVVFLGTPSQGSELADWLHLRLNKIYRLLFGPAGFQLQTSETSKLFKNPVDFELGVIMGNKPDIKLRCFKGENDGMVSVKSSKVDGMKDHILLPVSHTQMLISKKAFFQIDHFLKNGFFYRA